MQLLRFIGFDWRNLDFMRVERRGFHVGGYEKGVEMVVRMKEKSGEFRQVFASYLRRLPRVTIGIFTLLLTKYNCKIVLRKFTSN